MGVSMFLVAENKFAIKKSIKSGTSYDGKTVVESGLQAGDKLITFGFSDVVDGQKLAY